MTANTTHTDCTITTTVEASPGPGMTLEQLHAKLLSLGHKIVSIDRDRQTICVLHQTEVAHSIVRPEPKEN